MPYGLEDLGYLMDRLRDPETGCPWDLEQDFASIVPHTLEEAYEVADTIEREDWDHLKDELGDLLFQVVFYARLAKEESLFDLPAVIDHLVSKLVRRHPHIFPDGQLRSLPSNEKIRTEAVNDQWEKIKSQERSAKSRTSLLDEVPLALPGLSRAAKLQKRASNVGFDWFEAEQVLDKIEEEIGELRQAIQSKNSEEITDEMGDLLFAQANLARKLGVDPEQAIRSTNAKFERRFRYIETRVAASDKNWNHYSLDELDELWNQAKTLSL